MHLTHDPKYEKNIRDYLQTKLPDKVYDAHFHLNQRQVIPVEKAGHEPYDMYFEFMESVLGKGRLNGGLMMPQPLTVDLNEWDNVYNLKISKANGYDAGLLLTPDYGREKAEKMIAENPHITALKPYLSYMPDDVKFESDILDFAPEWIWQLANDREMPVILHLSHYGNMLSEKANHEQICYISKKYPKAKIVLAHCALGHHVRKLRMGLEHISGLKNIWFDFSGISETLSMYYCIKAFGPERMMFGGDYKIGSSYGKICTYGSNFIGFHPSMVENGDCPPDYKYQPLTMMEESLLAFFDAAELLCLSDSDIEKIFYSTAKSVFGKK